MSNKLLERNDVVYLRNLSRDLSIVENFDNDAVFLNGLANRLEKLIDNIGGQ